MIKGFGRGSPLLDLQIHEVVIVESVSCSEGILLDILHMGFACLFVICGFSIELVSGLKSKWWREEIVSEDGDDDIYEMKVYEIEKSNSSNKWVTSTSFQGNGSGNK